MRNVNNLKMRNVNNRGTLRALAAVVALSIMATACGDDPIAPHDEPETERIVLTIGTATVTWLTANGSVSPTTISIPAGQSRTVTAAFLRADGSVDPIVTAADFRLDFNATGGSGVTFTRTGNLTGTLTAGATAAQSTTFTLALYHLEEGHQEYATSAGALTVTVQ